MDVDIRLSMNILEERFAESKMISMIPADLDNALTALSSYPSLLKSPIPAKG
jgi:hypothetical protein